MCELDYNVREKSVDIQFQLDASVFDSSEIDMFIFCKVVEGVGGDKFVTSGNGIRAREL